MVLFIYSTNLLTFSSVCHDCVAECPKGVAWIDKAYSTDLAHQLVTCSNAGTCDYSTYKCKCFDGFTGEACEKSKFGPSYWCYDFA